MLRYLLHRLAAIALIAGVTAAVLVPAERLDLCTRFGFLQCEVGDVLYMRFALGVISAMTAVVLFSLGSLATRR